MLAGFSFPPLSQKFTWHKLNFLDLSALSTTKILQTCDLILLYPLFRTEFFFFFFLLFLVSSLIHLIRNAFFPQMVLQVWTLLQKIPTQSFSWKLALVAVDFDVEKMNSDLQSSSPSNIPFKKTTAGLRIALNKE